MNIACIIIGIDGWEQYTLPLIKSICEHEPSCEMVVVDNGSEKRYPPLYEVNDVDHSFCYIAHTERFCYSKAINYGKGIAGDADWYIVLSNDVLCNGPFAHLLAEYDGSDIVGPLLKEVYGYPYLEGWCVAISRKAWGTIGGWDENYQVSSYEDVDFSTSALEHGFGLTEDKRLPFTHLDQKQRFGLVPDYWSSEAHNQAYFLQKHAGAGGGG